MMSGGDRLSDLPNDLLRRVLYFAPAREGASTSALSRRWRGLWRSSGAVNLDIRVPEEAHYAIFFDRRDAIVSAAKLSLEAAAADSPVIRLAFRLVGSRCHIFPEFLYRDLGWGVRSPDVVTELLSLPAARRVEELRLAAVYADEDDELTPWRDDQEEEEEETSLPTTAFYDLSGSLCLLSGTLRVLDLTGCRDLAPSPAVAFFPRLASMRLSHCSVCIDHLQDFIHAAPVLVTVHLESVKIRGESARKGQPLVTVHLDSPQQPREGFDVLLHCPAATELVLDRCCWVKEGKRGGAIAVEIDAPRLRRFRYKGLLRQLALSSQAPDLAQVDLHLLPCPRGKDAAGRRDPLSTFWRLAQNFSNAKELKLRVNMLEDIAVVRSASQAKLLCSFRNLRRLHLEGMHRLKGKTAAVAVANLLWCCPVLSDLRINLTMAQPADLNIDAEKGRRFLEQKYRHDFENSIHCFNNRKSEAMVVPIGGDYDARYDKLSDLPALSSGNAFDCLLSTLSCVRLQFQLETNMFELKLRSNFAAKLIKFFAENAAVLEEMHIDDGNGKMCEHMNYKIERWIANSSEKRKTTFVVLPLKVER